MPKRCKFPCITCGKAVGAKQDALLCVNCFKWCHFNCSSVERTFFLSNDDWICPNCCFKELPFYCLVHQDTNQNTHLPESIDDESFRTDRISTDNNNGHVQPRAEVTLNTESNFTVDEFHRSDSDDIKRVWHVEEQFRTLNKCNGMKIAHLNCSSLTKNIDEIRLILKETHLDILTLSETHLCDFIEVSEISCEGYLIERRDRNRSGGGVVTYIREDHDYTVRNDIAVQELEMIVIEVKRPFNRSIFIVNWYRPPNSNVANFQSLETVIEKLDATNRDCIVLGDMNCDVMKIDKPLCTKRLFEIMERFNFKQVISSPTRVTNDTATLIDLIWTNEPDRLGRADVIETALSDHYLVYCTVGKRHSSKENEHRYKLGRKMNKINTEKLREDISAVSWEEVEKTDDVVEAYDIFENAMLRVIDKHAPVRKTRIKKKESPWISNNVLILIRQRNEQKKKAKQSGASQDWERYKHLRNKVTSCIRHDKKNYVSQTINKSNCQSADIWKSLKCLMPQKCNSVKIPSIMKDDHNVTDKTEIANSFNNHFISIGRKIQERVTITDNDCQNENFFSLNSTLPNRANSFRFEPVNEQKVLDVINNLKENKACGPDNIPSAYWKTVADIIVKPFTYIINLSFKRGTAPAEWKKSRVIPIYKSGNKCDLNNYRPISILSVSAKIVEKLAFDQLYSYVNQKGILSPFQCGFRPKHSTLTASLNVTEDWSESLDKGFFIGVVTLDLQKAFDTVDHVILLKKLRLIGADDKSIKWFTSYLTNRMQYTCVNGVESTEQTMQCGIPQGSILGPLLFVIYINDLTTCIRKCKTSLYADDTCLYFAGDDPKSVTESLNSELLIIDKWLKINKLVLNVKKCEFLLIGSKKRLKNAVVPDVLIQNTPISRVTHCKYLGVIIDEHLDWIKHTDYLGKKIAKDIYLLKRIRPYLTQETALTYYKSIIQSRFDYCSLVWGNAGKGILDKLQKLQNRALRIILKVDWRFPSHSLYDILKIDNLSDRRNKQILHMMFKIAHDMIPGDFLKYFVPKEFHYGLRNAHKCFELPKPRTNFKKKSFQYRGIKEWNQLPRGLKDMSFNNFRLNI